MEMLRVGVASELWVVSSMMGMCACVWGLCVYTSVCGGCVHPCVCVDVDRYMLGWQGPAGCLEDRLCCDEAADLLCDLGQIC